MYMRSALVFLHLVSLVSALASAVPASNLTGVCPDIFDDLVFYFKYASSAYSDSCPSPNGNTLILQINNTETDTQGFIARDDTRREIVVAFRGSTSDADFATDFDAKLTPFVSHGITPPAGAMVHHGFLTAWNSVSAQVLATVQTQLAGHTGYGVVSTGHSLGGALGSLAAVAIHENFQTGVRMFTYGQPRTGNAVYAAFVNEKFGAEAFRDVHTTDGVPTMIPTSDGYRHHGIEYWQTQDPATANDTRKCAADGEDPTCSASIKSGGINAAHFTYFDIPFGSGFC